MQTILLAGCPHRAHFVNKETIFPTYRDFESPSHLRRLESPCILIDRIEDGERERETLIDEVTVQMWEYVIRKILVF